MSIPSSAKEILKPGVVTIISKTYCPFCDKAKGFFKSLGVKVNSYEVDLQEFPDTLINEFHDLAKIKTYPKNFIGEQCVGGYDGLQSAYKSGELFKLFESQNIEYKKPSF